MSAVRSSGPSTRGAADEAAGLDDDEQFEHDTVAVSGLDFDDLPPPMARASGHAEVAQGALSASDIVPALRPDLRLLRRPSGQWEVQDPARGRVFVLNDFEISLVRMLNGRRPAAEILESSRRLEIPINLESLYAFVTRLDRDGLLAEAPAAASSTPRSPAAAATTWPSRSQWEASVRSLFQSGIRLLRMGKHAEAASYFEALLQEDPDHMEARELLAMSRFGPAESSEGSTFAPQAPAPQAAAPRGSGEIMSAGPPPTIAEVPHGLAFATNVPVAHAPVAASGYGNVGAMIYAPNVAPAYAPPGYANAAAQIAPAKSHKLHTALQIGVSAALACAAVFVFQLARGSGSSTVSEPTIAMTPTGPAVSAPKPPLPPNPPPAAARAPAPPMPAPAPAPEPVARNDGADSATKSVQAAAEPIPTERSATRPAPPIRAQVTRLRLDAPTSGAVTAFLTSPRRVHKDERLFEIVRVTSDPATVKALAAKVSSLELLAKQDHVYDAFLADAKRKLASGQHVSTTYVVAPRAGKAIPHVHQGVDIRTGQLMAEIE